MQEYVGAEEIKRKSKKELENFFESVDCDYKQLNIKNTFIMSNFNQFFRSQGAKTIVEKILLVVLIGIMIRRS